MKIPHPVLHIFYCAIIGGLLLFHRYHDRQQQHVQVECAQLLNQCSDIIAGFNSIQETWIRMGIESYSNEVNLRWQNRLDAMDSLLADLDGAVKKEPLDRIEPALKTERDRLIDQFPDEAALEPHINRIFLLHKAFSNAEPDLLRQVMTYQEVLAKNLILQEAARRGAGCEDCSLSNYDIIQIRGTDTVSSGMPYKAIFRLVPVHSRDIFKIQCKINGVEYPVDRDLQVTYSETSALPGRRRILVQISRTNPLTRVVEMYQREFEYFSEEG